MRSGSFLSEILSPMLLTAGFVSAGAICTPAHEKLRFDFCIAPGFGYLVRSSGAYLNKSRSKKMVKYEPRKNKRVHANGYCYFPPAAALGRLSTTGCWKLRIGQISPSKIIWPLLDGEPSLSGIWPPALWAHFCCVAYNPDQDAWTRRDRNTSYKSKRLAREPITAFDIEAGVG